MISAIAVSVVLAAVLFAILPDEVTVQITASKEEANTMSKPLALAFPFAITCIPAVLYHYLQPKTKYILFSALGIVCYLLTWYMNT